MCNIMEGCSDNTEKVLVRKLLLQCRSLSNFFRISVIQFKSFTRFLMTKNIYIICEKYFRTVKVMAFPKVITAKIDNFLQNE